MSGDEVCSSASSPLMRNGKNEGRGVIDLHDEGDDTVSASKGLDFINETYIYFSRTSTDCRYAPTSGRYTSLNSVAGQINMTRWLLISRLVMTIVYSFVVIVTAVVMWQMIKKNAGLKATAWVVGAFFVGISVPLSLHDIHMHLVHYVSPIQRHYIRILAMVPIYTIESWLALRFVTQKIYLETAREAYEGYVIYSFYKMLCEYMGPERDVIRRLIEKHNRDESVQVVPFCCLRGWRFSTGAFTNRCAFGVFQYVVIRVISALVILLAEFVGTAGVGKFEWHYVYPYVVTIINLSQFYALYCLVLFYMELKEELHVLRPFGKFLVVKAVVFFSFWQSVLIWILTKYGVLKGTEQYSVADVGSSAQNLLICIEMAFAAWAHHHLFSWKDFKVSDGDAHSSQPIPLFPDGRRSSFFAVRHVLPYDVIQEASTHVTAVRMTVTRSFQSLLSSARMTPVSQREKEEGLLDNTDCPLSPLASAVNSQDNSPVFNFSPSPDPPPFSLSTPIAAYKNDAKSIEDTSGPLLGSDIIEVKSSSTPDEGVNMLSPLLLFKEKRLRSSYGATGP